MSVEQVEFAGHVVHYGVRPPTPWNIACLENWDKPCTVSELKALLGFANYYQELVRLYTHHVAPLYSMLQLSKSEARRGSSHPLHWTPELDSTLGDLKRELLKPLTLFLGNVDKPFVIRTDASDYVMGAVLERNDEKANHYPVAFWSRVLTPSERKSWTRSTEEACAIKSALRQWAGHIGLQPVCVCTDRPSLRNWHTDCVLTPSGPAARVARCHQTFSNFDLSVVYIPGKDNTIGDVLSCRNCPAGGVLQDFLVQGDVKETELAKRLIAFTRQCEQGITDPEAKCFVVQKKMAPTAHMLRSLAASISPIACPSAPSVLSVFTANNDVLTHKWGPA